MAAPARDRPSRLAQCECTRPRPLTRPCVRAPRQQPPFARQPRLPVALGVGLGQLSRHMARHGAHQLLQGFEKPLLKSGHFDLAVPLGVLQGGASFVRYQLGRVLLRAAFLHHAIV